jgi:hypothetical protein
MELDQGREVQSGGIALGRPMTLRMNDKNGRTLSFSGCSVFTKLLETGMASVAWQYLNTEGNVCVRSVSG